MATLTLDEFKELRAQGLSTDQIIKFENGEKPAKTTKPSLREGTPLESKFYTEGIAPILHGGSTFALGMPKMIADQQGEGAREAVFPEQTTLPGKALRGVSEAAGFTVGLPMRIGAAAGRLGVAAGRKLLPQVATQTGKLAATAGQAGRLATEGAAAGLALEPENDMSRLEQAMLFGGFGGAVPVAVQGVKGVGGFVGNNFKAVVKNVGGISDSTLKTIRELGASKVFEPAKATADYISTNLLPRTRAKIDAAVATFTPNIQRLLKEKYGVADEAVGTIKKRGVDAVNAIRQKYNDSTDYFHKVIKSGIDAKKAEADKAYADAVDSMKGDSIYIDSMLRTLKNKLTMAKYVDFMGNPMQSYKSGLDPQLDALTSLYLQLKPGATATGTAYKGALISKDQFSLYRDLLGRMLKERPSDRYVMAVRNALYKDAERSGMTGLRAARDMERKAFSVIGKYMGKDGSIKALGKEPSLDRYHALTEEQKRQLRDLEKFVGVKFVDELEALTAARSLDKLSKFTDEQIVSDLISARNPNQTKMVLSKYRSILGDSFKDEADDLMAHFANSDFNIISSTPGAGGGVFPSRSGLLRGATSEAAKRYLRDIRPGLGKLSEAISGTGQKLKQAVIAEREKPDYRIKGLTTENQTAPEFIRKSTEYESRSNSAKNKAYSSFPDKFGYQKVYMPYGPNGRGFYYIKASKLAGVAGGPFRVSALYAQKSSSKL